MIPEVCPFWTIVTLIDRFIIINYVKNPYI